MSKNVWRGIILMMQLNEPLDCFGADPRTAPYFTASVLPGFVYLAALCARLGIIGNKFPDVV
jgi:hypothetical protein